MRISIIGLLLLALYGVLIPANAGSDLSQALLAPTWAHPLGTDALGRDLLVRLAEGLRLSLWVGLWASVVALGIGSVYGAVAAMRGGRTDAALMRIVDVVNGLPLVLFVVLVTLYAGRSELTLFVAIGAIEWTTLARMVRARLIALKGRDFVRAAQTFGSTPARLLWRHYLPHTATVALSYAALNLPAILILEATLSYLGLGVQPPHASLGVLLKEGAEGMSVYPWLIWAPAGLFVWLLATVNAVGEKLKKQF